MGASQFGSVGKKSTCNVGDAGDVGSIPRSYPLEEGMAPHSSILAWRIPWTEEPGRLQSMGSWRVRHGWSDWACTHTLLNNPLSISVKTCQQKGTSNINSVLFIKVVMLIKGSSPVFCHFTFDHIESSLIFEALSLAVSFLKVVLKGKIEGNCHCWAYIWDSKL